MKNSMRRMLLSIAALLAVAGCDGVENTSAGSAVSLSTLSEADITVAQLPGELACSFSTPDAGLLLLATGDVASSEPAEGVSKVAGALDRVTSPGGFGSMLDGGTFTGSTSTLRIDVTGPAIGGGEAPPSPATLILEAPGTVSQRLVGSWTCGP